MGELLVVDIDDTTHKWRLAFKSYITRLGFYTRSEEPDSRNLTDWILDNNHNQATAESVIALINDFNTSWHFSQLEEIAYAKATIEKLKSHNYHVIGVSSCGNHPLTVIHRYANMTNFAKFPVICLPLGASKKEVLRGLIRPFKRGYFVDDAYHNCLDATEVGFTSFLFSSSQNCYLTSDSLSETNVTRVDTWLSLLTNIEPRLAFREPTSGRFSSNTDTRQLKYERAKRG